MRHGIIMTQCLEMHNVLSKVFLHDIIISEFHNAGLWECQ